MVVYLISLPATIRALWFSALDDLLSPDALPGEVWIPFSRFLRLTDVAEWVPSLLLFLGVISLGLPGLRGLWVRKAYGLRDPPDLPVVGEIREFLSIHAPGLSIKANLLRTDLLAFVMPLGYRATAIALFGGLVVLWRRDREAAQAVLLHESGHARQGDVFAVGMGSAFKALLDVWLPLTLGAVVLPMVLVWGMDAGRFVILGDLSPREGVTHKLVQLAVVYLPGLGLTMGGLFVESLGTIILPLAGLWIAEFYADHRAVVMQGTPGPLLRNLEASERGGGGAPVDDPSSPVAAAVDGGGDAVTIRSSPSSPSLSIGVSS